MGRTIGIDLGTSRTCAAIVSNGRPQVLRSAMGYTTIPSVLTFDDAGAPVVGQKAERQMALRPQDTVYGSKRLLGRAYLKGVKQRFQPHFTYELVELDGQVAARVCGRVISLTEVAARILEEVRAAAESALGEPVDKAVVTVPAYFTDPQRACVKEAGKLANLHVLRTINEPTAAALAFGTRQTQRKKVLVYDLGGGTFDVSIVDIDGAYYKVLGVDGDTFLGGLDFDDAMAGVLGDRLSAKHGDTFALTVQSQERLREAAQEAKHRLSGEEVTQVQLLQLELGTGEHIDVNETVTRSELERASAPLIDKTLDIVARALDSVGVSADEIDDLLLVGGQTRMPLVHARLEAVFGRPPSKRVHPDEVVAIGAAIAADSLNREGAPVLVDVLPMAIGIGHADDEFEIVVPKNSAVPCQGQTGFVIPPGATSFSVPVHQGNSVRTSANAYLGQLDLPDLPASADKRAGQLELALDGEGMLQITVTVPALRLARSIQLTTRAPVTTADHEIDHVPVAVRRSKHVEAGGGGTSARVGWWARVLRALRLARPDARG